MIYKTLRFNSESRWLKLLKSKKKSNKVCWY